MVFIMASDGAAKAGANRSYGFFWQRLIRSAGCGGLAAVYRDRVTGKTPAERLADVAAVFTDRDRIFEGAAWQRLNMRYGIIPLFTASEAPWQHGEHEERHRRLRQQVQATWTTVRSQCEQRGLELPLLQLVLDQNNLSYPSIYHVD